MPGWTVPGYTELRELGSGASGRVVLATHDATRTPVAIKYLAGRLCADSAFRSAFRSEAELLAGLTSPYVAVLYEYVEVPQTAAIVMELVDGVSLRRLIHREGPIGPEAALVVLKGSLLGLAAAHEYGVVHRDYKPDNVLVGRDGLSKLVDFGIAARDGDRAKSAGTPAYMAPEQWHGEPASPAADVYAATACFFECLTGRKPYTGQTVIELAVQHASAPVPDQDDDVPVAVRELVRRGLAKAPQERPADAAAFMDELEAVAGSAYGPDWEERGQNRLAALAALFPLLLRLPQDAQGGTVDLATTKLGGKAAWHKLLLGTGTLVLAGVLAAAAVAGGSGPGGTGSARADVGATTSADPAMQGEVPATSAPDGEESASSQQPPSPGADSSAGAAAPSTGDESLPQHAAPSAGEDAGVPESTPAGPSDTVGTAPPEPNDPGGGGAGHDQEDAGTSGDEHDAGVGGDKPKDPPPAAEHSISVPRLKRVGDDSASTTIRVTTQNRAPVILIISWHDASNGRQDGPAETVTLSGRTSYTVTRRHTFQDDACRDWEVRVTTLPGGLQETTGRLTSGGECKPR